MKEAHDAIEKRVPLIIGSGMTVNNIKDYLPYVDYFIIGTAMKTNNMVDEAKVQKFKELINT